VSISNLLHDAQPETGSASVARSGFVESGEAIEDSITICRPDSSAVVGHGKDDAARAPLQSELDPLLRMSSGVVDQVAHHSAKIGSVPDHRYRLDAAEYDSHSTRRAQQFCFGEQELV